MHKWLTFSLVKTEIYFENCVKRPQKSRFIFPYYEGTDISAVESRRKNAEIEESNNQTLQAKMSCSPLVIMEI